MWKWAGFNLGLEVAQLWFGTKDEVLEENVVVPTGSHSVTYERRDVWLDQRDWLSLTVRT